MLGVRLNIEPVVFLDHFVLDSFFAAITGSLSCILFFERQSDLVSLFNLAKKIKTMSFGPHEKLGSLPQEG